MASRTGTLAASTSGCRQAGGSGSSSLACLLPLRHQLAARASPRPACSKRSITTAASQQQEPSQGVTAVNPAAAACGSAAAGAEAGAAAQPLPSRLQREVDALVGLDVEYAHLRLPGGAGFLPGWDGIWHPFPVLHTPPAAQAAGSIAYSSGAPTGIAVLPATLQMAATSACQLRCVPWTQPAKCCCTRTSTHWVRALAPLEHCCCSGLSSCMPIFGILHAAHAPQMGCCCESAASPPVHPPPHSALH